MRHAEHINSSTGPNNPGFWEAFQKLGMPEQTVLETIEADDVDSLVYILNNKETYYIHNEKATDPQYGYNRMSHGMVYRPDAKLLQKEYERLCQIAIEEQKPFLDGVTDKYLHGREDEMTEVEKVFVRGYLDTNNPFVGVGEPEDIKAGIPFSDEDDEFFKSEAIDYAIWSYQEETKEIVARYIGENADVILRREHKSKIIQQIDKEGNVIHEFLSWNEIREALNIGRIDNILNVVKGRQKTAFGYIWRYKPVEGAL